MPSLSQPLSIGFRHWFQGSASGTTTLLGASKNAKSIDNVSILIDLFDTGYRLILIDTEVSKTTLVLSQPRILRTLRTTENPVHHEVYRSTMTRPTRDIVFNLLYIPSYQLCNSQTGYHPFPTPDLCCYPTTPLWNIRENQPVSSSIRP